MEGNNNPADNRDLNGVDAGLKNVHTFSSKKHGYQITGPFFPVKGIFSDSRSPPRELPVIRVSSGLFLK
jgi:hypothetical protein